MLAGGRVRVNGTIARRADTALAAGDVVEVAAKGPRAALPPGLALVYEDGDVIVVDKPAGLLTIATERERERTVYAHLMARAEQEAARPRVRGAPPRPARLRPPRLRHLARRQARAPGAVRGAHRGADVPGGGRGPAGAPPGHDREPAPRRRARPRARDSPPRAGARRRHALARAPRGRAPHAARGEARDRAAEPDPRAP